MIEAISPVDPTAVSTAPAAPAERISSSFAALLVDQAESVDQTIQQADSLARAFALDDSVPVHQVTFALEQARLSFELMMQVRTRLVEGYQEIMRMQL